MLQIHTRVVPRTPKVYDDDNGDDDDDDDDDDDGDDFDDDNDYMMVVIMMMTLSVYIHIRLKNMHMREENHQNPTLAATDTIKTPHEQIAPPSAITACGDNMTYS